MKILQVVRQYLPSTGGMETYVSSLNQRLAVHGHRSDVATLDYLFKSNQPLPHFERIDGTDIIRLPSSGNARYFFAPRIMEMAHRYDVIHVHGVDFFIDALGTCKWAHSRPLVLSTHGGFFHTPWMPALKKTFFQTVTRASLLGVDRVIACSPKDRELFKQVSSRVTLVENGIDYGTFAGVVKPWERVQAVGDGGNKLVFIGRISKNKRVDRLLEMLARLRQDVSDATLTVIGPDWEGLLAGLRQTAVSLGVGEAVDFTGVLPQDKMLAELAGARLFVSASEYEAFGLSTVEAMASGTLPVVNRIPAFSDLVDDGETGFLTDFSDPRQTAAAVRGALELPDERLLELGAASRRAAARHDWDRVAGRIIEIYEEVIAGQGH